MFEEVLRFLWMNPVYDFDRWRRTFLETKSIHEFTSAGKEWTIQKKNHVETALISSPWEPSVFPQ